MNQLLPIMHRKALAPLVAPALAALLLAASIAAQPAFAGENHVTISAASYGATRQLNVEVNKTVLLDLPAGAAEVIVTQPSVAAAIMRSRTRAIVQGVAGGTTNIFFLDDRGQTISVLDVTVAEQESGMGRSLEAALARTIPGSNIRVEAISGGTADGATHFLMTGTVLSGEDKTIAEQLASELSGGEAKGSLIQVLGSQQVMLQVTVSEIKRDVAKQLGINLYGTVTIGSANLGFNNGVTGGTNATGNFPIGNVSLQASLDALEQRGAVHVLAQPTLTAMSGETADFLAGGELPYSTVDGNGNPTTIFKPYGIQLTFTPTVKSNGVVGLKVDTAVSEPASNGSINKRQAVTSVELPAGNTLAIGGLLDQRTTQNIDQLPGLGNIPILGALFRSRDYLSQETELVILVTPYLVNSTPAGTVSLPTDRSTVPSDAEAVFLGKLENIYGVGGTGEMRGGFSGSVGFVLD